MKIHRISIDGYGRFAGLELAFSPGLQVVIGPNEQGKSTIRAYINEMLFGQKRGTTQCIYDESNELRIPWANPDCYGGTLRYVLDNGQEIEVIRNFDRNRESVQVFDFANGHEITADFELLRNRELNFAAAQLGVSKEVFSSVATIGHFTLDELGNSDALREIQEKLLTLADSSEEANSADATLRLLKERVAAIGPPDARNRPLPQTRVHVAALREEQRQALELQHELQQICGRRHGLIREISAAREQRLAREEELRALEAHVNAVRLREAESLVARINAATQQCFALGSVRDFPLQHAKEVSRAETQIATAVATVERSRKEHEQILHQLKEERKRLGAEQSDQAFNDVPEDKEARLAKLQTGLQHLRERLSENEAATETAAKRLREAQDHVGELPDFSRVASDPVEWITQLASSFSVALRTRDDEVKLRTRLRAEVEQRRAATKQGDELFAECQDFSEQAREFELDKRVHHEHVVQRKTSLQTLQLSEQEITEELPGFYWLAGLCGAGLLAMLIAFFATWHTPILIAAAVIAAAALYYGSKAWEARLRLARTVQQRKEIGKELEELEQVRGVEPGLIEKVMAKAGCDTVRELEAIHEHYRAAAAELRARQEALDIQEEKTAEAEERVEKMLARLSETFGEVGEQLGDPQKVQEASGRIIARYQEYREAKRHVTDCRSVLEKHQAEHKRLSAIIANAEAERATLEQELRAFLRENGFADEADHADASAAIRAYRGRILGRREQRARVELLQEKAHAFTRQIKAEEFDLEKHEQQLAHFLATAGVSSLDHWHESAEKAREYEEIRGRRTSLEEQLNTLLRGQDIKQLREAVKGNGALPSAPKVTRDQIKEEIAALNERIDALMKEEHALHITLTQRSGGMRSLNEIEEELAQAEARLHALSLEFEATVHAMALIEDIARDKHARMAPRLAEEASRYLAAITEGAYQELVLSRDLGISVRIPQTNHLNAAPEKNLSKGTVDQIYFALRLALLRVMSDTGESLPMLLDDPFANYDDQRLERTLRLLAEVTQEHQVLLFTCREDVVRAAEAVNAPVLRLSDSP